MPSRRPSLPSRLLRAAAEYSFEEQDVLGMRVLLARMGTYDGLREKKLLKMTSDFASRLAGLNVDKILLESNFPARDPLKYFERLDSVRLFEGISGSIGVKVAEDGALTAAFFAHTIGRDEERALLKLARVYRYLIVVTDRDGDKICRSLRGQYGVAAIESPTPELLRTADFAAFMTAPRRRVHLKPGCVVFSPADASAAEVLGGRRISDVTLSIPKEIQDKIPPGFDANPVISAAIRYGFFSPEQARVVDYTLDNAI